MLRAGRNPLCERSATREDQWAENPEFARKARDCVRVTTEAASTTCESWIAPPAVAPLRSRIVRALKWQLGSQFGSQGLRFAANLVLTRLLVPEAFGLMGMVQVFIISVQMISDVGLLGSVVHHERGEDRAVPQHGLDDSGHARGGPLAPDLPRSVSLCAVVRDAGIGLAAAADRSGHGLSWVCFDGAD